MSTPILPTSVIGSHAYPGWMLAALEAIEAGKFGETDRQELFDMRLPSPSTIRRLLALTSLPMARCGVGISCKVFSAA